MSGKNSFVMYLSWATMIENLPEEQAGELIKAICAKQNGHEYQIKDPVVMGVFAMIEQKMNEDAENYRKTCEKRSEAGKKGNEKRWEESQNIANDRKCDISDKGESQSVTKIADTDSDTDTESDTESDTDTEKKKRVAHPRPVSHKHGEFGHVMLTDDQLQKLVDRHGEIETEKAIKRVDEYCEQSGKRYKNYALVLENWGFKPDRNARSGTTNANPYDHTEEVMSWHISG